ncbi:zinc knuckle family protein, partial [Trifolium medium]|nr:zinc knuckle family protein [Trifolium medium]
MGTKKIQICVQENPNQQSWYLDSGCSRHMTGEKHMFQTLNLMEGGYVGFGGNQKGKIIGTVTVGNSSLSIKDV